MKKISVKEFSDICDNINPKAIIFASINQSDIICGHPVQYDLVFSNILITYFPNIIKLYNPTDSMIVRWIDYIIEEDTTTIGRSYTFVCHNPFYSGDIRYTFVIR